MTARRASDGPGGQVIFAVSMLLVLAALNVINGLAVLLKADWIVFARENAWLLDFAVWGWITLVLAFGQALVALGLLAGSEVARAAGILIAVISAVIAVFIIPIYPIWGVLTFVLTVLLVYSLTAARPKTQQ